MINGPKNFMGSDNKVFLLPGKISVAKTETLITTLLGSCVAVALHDPLTKVGGLNHYLLPEVPPNDAGSARYGAWAIKDLINQMEKLGADPYQLQAKIFGGANVLVNNAIGEAIGKRNIEIAQRLLRELGIPIIRKDVGGERGRKITLNTSTFEVLVSYNGEPKAA